MQTITLFITKVSLYEIYDALQKKIMKMNLFIICKLRLVKTFSLYIITAMKSVSVTGKIEEEREWLHLNLKVHENPKLSDFSRYILLILDFINNNK